ncbi:MAG: DUF1343 domain-containing protein [Nannocystis sp.]|nr:DUF1343 domain-containing protein [Nannocystis sp.]
MQSPTEGGCAVMSGLDRLAAGEGPRLTGASVALLCHAASVSRTLEHVISIVQEKAGARLSALLGPEHGIDAIAQDMEPVADGAPGIACHSLYGDDFASLTPTAAMFGGAEWLICDLQDVGSRYYTYVWTMVLATEAALAAGMKVLILDRPNPLGGLDAWVEGGGVAAGEESFVGLHDVAVRHGMTCGELVTMALAERGAQGRGRVEVLECAGWRRSMLFPETDLPWVLPSPNMPLFTTACVYPGMCLVEGTNLSEGRGLTRPFEIFGAPFIRGEALAAAIPAVALGGVRLRPLAFKPCFHKFAGARCGGVQIHVEAPRAIRPLTLGWALLAACWRQSEGAMRWRTERYEFVDDRPAIDLLAGGAWLRAAIEGGASVEEIAGSQEAGRGRFLARRRGFLRYAE